MRDSRLQIYRLLGEKTRANNIPTLQRFLLMAIISHNDIYDLRTTSIEQLTLATGLTNALIASNLSSLRDIGAIEYPDDDMQEITFRQRWLLDTDND